MPEHDTSLIVFRCGIEKVRQRDVHRRRHCVFFPGRFNWIRRMFPERSVMMSFIILISRETVEKLEWAALLWILVKAKARSAVPISAAISAKRATQASAKINATLEGARQKGSWLRRMLVIPQVRDGDAPRLLLAIRPSASTRDPFHFFKSLLSCHCSWFGCWRDWARD